MDKVQALNNRPSSELELQDFEPQSMKRRLNGVSSNVRCNSARGGAKSHGTPIHQVLSGPPVSPLSPKRNTNVIDPSVEGEAKIMLRHTVTFPRFENGDVYIELRYRDSKYSYRLHSSVLSRASSWFAETLQQAVDECDGVLAAKIKNHTKLSTRYELMLDHMTGLGVLYRAPFTKIKNPQNTTPTIQADATAVLGQPSNIPPTRMYTNSDVPSSTAANLSAVAGIFNDSNPSGPTIKTKDDEKKPVIKEEDNEQKQSTAEAFNESKPCEPAKPNINSHPEGEVFLEAYNNLFLVYYNQTPKFDTTDINKAVRQTEMLILIAQSYGSVPMIRPYLNNAILQYGRDVYKAILTDPPRWLFLSLYLESTPVFKEAIVHIVGNYPNWKSATVDEAEFPQDVRDLIQAKIDDLHNLKSDIDKGLCMSSISIDGQSATLNTNDKSTHNTWLVVQYWRDWFSRSLSEASTARKDKDKCIDAIMYRTMAKGGDAYCPMAAVYEMLKVLRGKQSHIDDKDNKQEVDWDMKLMKDFAQFQVKPLCVNRSMLSVEEGIEYFTCVKVEHNELPWVKGDGA